MNRSNAKKLGKTKLLAQVKAELGVELPADTGIEKVLDYMQEQGLLDVEDNDQTDDADVIENPADGATHAKIMVHEDQDTSRNWVTASDENGVSFQIKKGEEVVVPIGVYHTLNDAMQTTYAPKTDETGQLIMRPIRRHTHPFNVLGFIKRK